MVSISMNNFSLEPHFQIQKMYENSSYCLPRSHVIYIPEVMCAIYYLIHFLNLVPELIPNLRSLSLTEKLHVIGFQSNLNKIGTETNFIVKEETKKLFYSWWMKIVI